MRYVFLTLCCFDLFEEMRRRRINALGQAYKFVQ